MTRPERFRWVEPEKPPEWERARFLPWVDARYFDGHDEYRLDPGLERVAQAVFWAIVLFSLWWLFGIVIWRIER